MVQRTRSSQNLLRAAARASDDLRIAKTTLFQVDFSRIEGSLAAKNIRNLIENYRTFVISTFEIDKEETKSPRGLALTKTVE
jgi:hypothetical protein